MMVVVIGRGCGSVEAWSQWGGVWPQERAARGMGMVIERGRAQWEKPGHQGCGLRKKVEPLVECGCWKKAGT